MAVGLTFVIMSGGIDLSVGAVVALTTMVSAALLERWHWSPLVVIPLVLAMGAGLGATMGLLIDRFRLCYLISIDSISIGDGFYSAVSQARIPVWAGAQVSVGAVLALVMVAVGTVIAHSTEFGRTVYAIGGSEQSAVLMGLPVRSTLVGVYA